MKKDYNKGRMKLMVKDKQNWTQKLMMKDRAMTGKISILIIVKTKMLSKNNLKAQWFL